LSSDNPISLTPPLNQSLSSSSSSLLSASSTTSEAGSGGDYYKIEAKLQLNNPDDRTNLQLQKFKRLLKRLELVYNTDDNNNHHTVPKMSTATIQHQPSNDNNKMPTDRYRFDSSRKKKN